jgi:hypothetical protein
VDKLEKDIKSWIQLVFDGVCTVDEATQKILVLMFDYVARGGKV